MVPILLTIKFHCLLLNLLLIDCFLSLWTFSSGLILLKMLSEYVDMNNSLPTLSSEVVHRVVEILKFFNTRTCQLVLGAGAMQVLVFWPYQLMYHPEIACLILF